MFEIREAHTRDDLLTVGRLKIELMRYHIEYAEKMGIHDYEISEYSMEQALSTASSRDSYLFLRNNAAVGMAQVEEQISQEDQSPILFVHCIYIMHGARNQSIGGVFLRYLTRKYHKRIECECWYGIPATALYEKAGFQPMMTRYVLPMSSRFYGSDQN